MDLSGCTSVVAAAVLTLRTLMDGSCRRDRRNEAKQHLLTFKRADLRQALTLAAEVEFELIENSPEREGEVRERLEHLTTLWRESGVVWDETYDRSERFLGNIGYAPEGEAKDYVIRRALADHRLRAGHLRLLMEISFVAHDPFGMMQFVEDGAPYPHDTVSDLEKWGHVVARSDGFRIPGYNAPESADEAERAERRKATARAYRERNRETINARVRDRYAEMREAEIALRDLEENRDV